MLSLNLNNDGSTKDFKERDALHYHCYTLEPLIKSAIVIHQFLNVNYYSQLDSYPKLESGINFLKPYIKREKTHLEFVNSNVNFDKMRSNNKQTDYIIGKEFDIEKSKNSILLASYFDKMLYKQLESYYKQPSIISTQLITYLLLAYE